MPKPEYETNYSSDYSVVIFACKKPITRNNEIKKIEFARSGAWSDWGVSISIDSSLSYKYCGDYRSEKQKYFVGKISRLFWDTLNAKLKRLNYKTVKPGGINNCKDCEYYELIIHWSNRTTRIFRSDTEPDDSFIRMCKWLGNIHSIPKLKQVKDSIKFETATHRTIDPAVKSIKFLPPSLK